MRRVSGSTGSRGCGSRKAGGVYLCTGLAEEGLPLSHFMIDPVRSLDLEAFRAPIVFKDPYNENLNHVLIWVGAEHYPSPADFLVECQFKGASRRIPAEFDLSDLTPGASRMVLVHPKAFTKRIDEPNWCPKDIHPEKPEPCLGAHWRYAGALGSKPKRGPDGDIPEHFVVGDLSYRGDGQIEVRASEFSPGAFLQLPVTHIEYQAKDVKDDGPDVLKKHDKQGWRVDIVDDPGVYVSPARALGGDPDEEEGV